MYCQGSVSGSLSGNAGTLFESGMATLGEQVLQEQQEQELGHEKWEQDQDPVFPGLVET